MGPSMAFSRCCSEQAHGVRASVRPSERLFWLFLSRLVGKLAAQSNHRSSRGASQSLERFKHWSVCAPPTFLAYPQPCLNCIATRRFYQAGSPQPNEAGKCPEPLSPTSALPSLGRCRLSPLRALPPSHRSYGVMCHSRWALLRFSI
jgi:hypothetical protein